MTQFVILKSTPDQFEVVNGTPLNYGLFAYRADSNYSKWVISDIKSGTLVQSKFNSLAACKAFAAELPEEVKQHIDTARATTKYGDACKRVSNIAKTALPSLPHYYEALAKTSFMTTMEELDTINDDPLNLFNL